jgi:polyisoprenoid-binding protein YceI
MNQRNVVIVIILAAVVGVAALAFIWFSGGSGEASQPLEAPTLVVISEPATTVPTAASEPTTAAEVGDPTTAPTAETAPQEETEVTLFNILPQESEVSFTLSEDLRGQPTTVVGVTDQVAGQLFVNFDDPAASQVGVIRINARTLATDSEFRNRAIRGQILRSAQDEYEFIDFTPTSIAGMPEAVTVGTPVTFQIVGDLKIQDITQPVTFDVTVTPVSEQRLEGVATTTVQRGDFGLTIPNAPGVANVSEEVALEINFVAAP